MTRSNRLAELVHRAWRSFALKLICLVAVFTAVPWIIYGQLQVAYEEQESLLLKSIGEQGRLLATGLQPYLDRFQPGTAPEIAEALAELNSVGLRTRVLLRPIGKTDAGSFYYVASWPPVPASYLEIERSDLLKAGVLGPVHDSCDTFSAPAIRYTNPTGQEEILTSITPYFTQAGCWAVICSSSAAEVLGSSIAGQPYWQTPQIRIALASYILMALFVISLFTDFWRSVKRLAGRSQGIRTLGNVDGSFAEDVTVPELEHVAREFDSLVSTLEGSAREVRYAAEENTHALKTPVGVIAQSIEGLRRSVPPEDLRGQRSVALIEQALDRLSGLMGAAQRVDEHAAELAGAQMEEIELSALVSSICADYAETLAESGRRLEVADLSFATVLATQELMEIVIENILDNAVSFTPEGGLVKVALDVAGRSAILTVEDTGPGVDAEKLALIFDRYYTERDHFRNDDPGWGSMSEHMGIGLWVVRRNVEAFGGTVRAENREPTGLRLRITLPLSSERPAAAFHR